MKIISLKKKKLGNEFSLIEIKYKNILGFRKTKDAIRNDTSWVWFESGNVCGNNNVLDKFFDSDSFRFMVNK